MRDIGAIIFLLFIVGQGVAAVVTSLKKRQAKAAAEQAAELSIDKKRGRSTQAQTQAQTQTQARSPVETRLPPVRQVEARTEAIQVKATQATTRRNEIIARRLEQVKDLRELKLERSANSPQQPQGQPRTAPPAKVPPRRQPVILKPVSQPEPNSTTGDTVHLEAKASKDVWAIAPVKRRRRHVAGIRSAFRSRARLRDLVVMKEVFETPLALRKDPFTPG
jgi:hypothetical protein